jgi:hypothetical protein
MARRDTRGPIEGPGVLFLQLEEEERRKNEEGW